jgi:UDP-N-acetylmuramoyl-tripeptide--D-alanyl-D-alanine ligase
VVSSALPTLHELETILNAAFLDRVSPGTASAEASAPETDQRHVRPSDVSIDSRTCTPGALFFALPGEYHDGHAFVAAAAAAGAVAAVVTRSVSPDGSDWPCPVLVVHDSLLALQELAAWYVTEYLSDTTVRIGITGSNGKTTTKEMLAAILTASAPSFASAGNLNSETGLPLSVLATPQGVTFAVYEMAMSNPGEMAPLARIVRPNHAVITNIGTAHIGLLGSKAAIAREKKDITSSFGGEETLYVPEEDEYRGFLSTDVRGRVVLTGPQAAGAELTLDRTSGNAVIIWDGDHFEVPFPGLHNGRNALTAIAVAKELGVDPRTALESLQRLELPDGRAQRIDADGIGVIHDAYNANPDSMAAAVTMAADADVSVLVLGDMYELGEYEAEEHLRVLRAAIAAPVRVVALVGTRFATALQALSAGGASVGALDTESGPRIVPVATTDELVPVLNEHIRHGDVVLLKGSRAVGLERCIPRLRALGTSREASRA